MRASYVVIALVGVLLCSRLGADAIRGGIARLYCTAAIIQARLESADEAVRLNGSDPETHYTRALSLVNLERLNEAVEEFREATRLRPHHYYQWMDLGVTLERLGDSAGALECLRESVRLAPNFAQPRWQLGSFFYRQGDFDQSFVELRRGARSNPTLKDGLLDLAWAASQGDVATTRRYVEPQTRHDYLLLTRFLERHGQVSDAVDFVKQLGPPQDKSESDVLKEIVADLLVTRRFSEGYQIWAAARGSLDNRLLANGDFSEPVQNDRGFGWQADNVPNVAISIDQLNAGNGGKSVCVEYTGDSSPGYQVVHQIVILRPSTRYVLDFMARADHLVSGGPPVVAVLDAKSDERHILGLSKPVLPQLQWSAYHVDFATDQSTSSAVIALQRNPCTQNPCPIFGKLWLTQFSLKAQ